MPARKASPRDRNSNKASPWGRKRRWNRLQNHNVLLSAKPRHPQNYYLFLRPSRTWDFQFDSERFGRPLCEVPLFQTATIPSTLAKDHKPAAFKPSFSIMPCQYARSIETAEPGPEPPRKSSSGSKRKYKSLGTEGWRSKHKHHSTTRRSPSRQATISCPCVREHKAPKASDHTRSCEFCHVTETPKWRSGPSGRRTLCNVCGLLYAKREEKARSFLLEREFGCDSVFDESSWSSTKVSTEGTHSSGLR